ncbi:MAG: Holliday junction resolvase RuvX [Mycoplasmoidaceae bacterium]
MKIIGIDYGLKRIGIAISIMSIVSPFKVLINKNDDYIFSQILDIIVEENIDEIIIGLPLSVNNEDNKISLIVKDFAKKLEKNIKNISIKFQNEYGTTNDAYAFYKKYNYKKKKIENLKDMMAACFILEKYNEKNDS